MPSITRRSFLAATSLALVAPAMAIEPVQRPGKSILKLSLAAYSLRKYLAAKPDAVDRLDLPGFIDYCAKLNLDGAEITAYYIPPSADSAYFNSLKRRAHLAGLDISGGAIGNNFTVDPGPDLQKQMTATKKWIDAYAELGAPVIRVFAGNPPRGVSEEEAIKRCVPALEEACEYAGKRGIMLAIENHDFTTKVDRLMQIIAAVKSPWFGVNFDSGNFHSADPYADMALIAPYAVNAQVKVELKPAGKKAEPTDLSRVVKILKDAGYSGYVVLEYEATEEPYDAIPRHVEALQKVVSAARG